MGEIKEENLDHFQEEVNRGRLSPGSGRYFLFGAFVYTSLVMWLMFYAVSKEGRDIFFNPFEEVVACIETILYVIQCVLLLPNLFVRSAFKFQKLQTIAIVFSSFQSATLPFMVIVVEGVFEVPSDGETVFYVGMLILGAIITHIIAVKSVFREAANGGYTPTGVQYWFFEKEQRLSSFIAATTVIIILILAASSINVDSDGTPFLFIQTVVLYGLAIGSADLVLLAYCRFKFPTFNRSWEDYMKEREVFLAYRKREREKERLKAEKEEKRQKRLENREQNNRKMLERWKQNKKKTSKK